MSVVISTGNSDKETWLISGNGARRLFSIAAAQLQSNDTVILDSALVHGGLLFDNLTDVQQAKRVCMALQGASKQLQAELKKVESRNPRDLSLLDLLKELDVLLDSMAHSQKK